MSRPRSVVPLSSCRLPAEDSEQGPPHGDASAPHGCYPAAFQDHSELDVESAEPVKNELEQVIAAIGLATANVIMGSYKY